MRKEHGGSLVKMAGSIQSLQIKGRRDFGGSSHTASTEPYFYNSAYQVVKMACVIPNDEKERCIVAKEIKQGNNKLPAHCVLNGLQLDPVPPELTKLDSLSKQLIQRPKCYQTVVRLGTYTGKVPVYNSLKACKGTIFISSTPIEEKTGDP